MRFKQIQLFLVKHIWYQMWVTLDLWHVWGVVNGCVQQGIISSKHPACVSHSLSVKFIICVKLTSHGPSGSTVFILFPPINCRTIGWMRNLRQQTNHGKYYKCYRIGKKRWYGCHLVDIQRVLAPKTFR